MDLKSRIGHNIAALRHFQGFSVGEFAEKTSRTASSKASTVSCAMNVSMKRCLAHCEMPAKRLRNGRRITTGADHTQLWGT